MSNDLTSLFGDTHIDNVSALLDSNSSKVSRSDLTLPTVTVIVCAVEGGFSVNCMGLDICTGLSIFMSSCECVALSCVLHYLYSQSLF